METTIIDIRHLQKQLETVEAKQDALITESETTDLERIIEILIELSVLIIKKQSLENRIKSTSIPKTKCTKKVMI